MKKGISRRNFLMITGGSGAGLMLKPADKLVNKLIPYVNPPIYPKPGIWDFYLTTCRECPAGCGMMLWHRDGRSTKAEGNPYHPLNKGKLCIRGQSSVQGEYDPDRLKKVFKKNGHSFIESNWNSAFEEIRKEIRSGKKVKVISDIQTGSLDSILKQFSRQFGNSDPLYFEPFNYESLRIANRENYGKALIPRYNIKDSDLIISAGAGFLDTWLSPVEYANDFSAINSFKNNRKGNLVYIGPAETLTAINSDLFIKTETGSEAAFLLKIIHELSKIPAYVNKVPANIPLVQTGNENFDEVKKVVDLIVKSKSPFVIAGNPVDRTIEGINTAKAANLLNNILGNEEKFDFSQYHALSKTALWQEIHDFFNSIGNQDIIIILNANPVYVNADFTKNLHRAAKLIYMGTIHNETADLADWILPVNYPLEEWGDYEPWKGTISLMQPTMQPIYDTKSAGDILLSLLKGTNESMYRETVWNNWLSWSANESILENKDKLLKKGHIQNHYNTEKNNFQYSSFPKFQQNNLNKENLFLYLSPSIFWFDGRLSNRPWLQEIPHPVSNIVWQSWLDINTEDAKKYGIDDSDVVVISANGKSLSIPVRVTENIAEGTVSLETGTGHTKFGKVATNLGVNGFQLLNFTSDKQLIIKIEKTGKNEQILYLNATQDQFGRDLLKYTDISFLSEDQLQKEEITWPTPEGYNKERDLYEPHQHKKHRWGMLIDIHACIGCKACEAACYAENNIPVVGRYHCERGREMSWLKVVPYKITERRTAFMPIPCQHCDAAPCEPVCPVFAAVHNEEGLNAQIYNRCIGTRYCSNNCPYKVRRFNWINIEHEFPETMRLNPEVTVRSRGVMEKCTFCVQRIRNAEYKALTENRELKVNEIIPACAQTCPTNAIIFGDLMDKNSELKQLMENSRRYQLLHELNTKPAVVYLKKIVV